MVSVFHASIMVDIHIPINQLFSKDRVENLIVEINLPLCKPTFYSLLFSQTRYKLIYMFLFPDECLGKTITYRQRTFSYACRSPSSCKFFFSFHFILFGMDLIPYLCRKL